jgi:hypothetical protein
MRMMAGLLKTFLVNYFVRHGYRAGREGFFYCFYNLVYDVFLAMRRFEREHGYDRTTIERRNDRWRDAILRQQGEAPEAVDTSTRVMP